MGKRKNFGILIILFILIIIIAIIVSLNLNYFNSLINHYIQDYGFIGVLFFSFLADLLEQPIGPEVVASIGVLFGLNLVLILIFSFIGSFLGSFVNYYVGREYLSLKVQQVCSLEKHKKYCQMFYRHGKWALTLAAISPIPWVAFCWLAGSFKMRIKDFALFGMIPRLLRIFSVAVVVWYLVWL